MEIRVDCYAGHRGEETPRCLHMGARAIEVSEVVDRWLAPEHSYFKVKGDDGALYILRHDEMDGRWDLTMYDRGGTLEAPATR
ncbi:MAG TPA: hypothetical protein VGB88_10200 [Alphaproteobacteria bacterium]